MKNYKDLLNELPSKSVVFAAGKFNPPNIGHELTVKVVRKLAKQRKADHFVFVSSVQDAKKNPLEVSKKIQYLDLLFPNTKFIQKELADAISSLKRYKNVVMVTSPDMVDEYKKLLKKYGFETVEVIPAGSKCPDSDDKLIKLASKGNYLSFKNGLPTTIRELDAKRLMNDIRIGLGLEPIKEQINLVKDDLREQYFRGEIFKEGDIVESNNTVYKIVKRGSNHLLLQDETGLKVSKWIQDVQLTERQFMLDEKLLKEDDQKAAGTKGLASANTKTAERQTKMAELKAAQAKEIERVKEKQAQELASTKSNMSMESVDSPVVNKNSKYNIAKSVMSLSDFRKTIGQTKQDPEAEETKMADTVKDGLVGNSHLHTDHSMRHRKVKYHLGESKLNPNDPHGDYKEKSKTLHQLSLDKNVDQAAVTQRKLDLEKEYSKLKEETLDQQGTRKAQLKRFKDQAAQAQLGTGCVKEDTYKGLEKEDKPGKVKTEFKGGRNSVKGDTVEGFKDEDIGFKHTKTTAVKEEFDDINEDELIALVEADLDNLSEDDFYEAYDDEELAIIDEDTGEELEAVAEEAEFDSEMIMEVLSRIERIRAKARMRRSAAKRQRREKIALRQLSTPQVANRRARRMAVSALKKRLLRGQNPQNVSVGQKERVERFIAQRRKIVDRLATRMVSRVKQVEKARMSHKRFTKPNNGVSF